MLDPLLERLRRALAPDYRVEREIARGGMGIVYRAHDVTLDCPVAVKILRPELDTAHAAESFLREAQILARVRHPNVVTVYRAGEGEGLHYYLMELIEGPTLQRRLAAGPLSRREALKLGRDLLDGLEAVHAAGIVHRDVKPGNVFLDRGRARLADFGIARPPSDALFRDGRTSAPQEGTVGYQAPEQMTGGPITPLTDVFAAGAVIYEAYTGRRLSDVAPRVGWGGVPRLVGQVLERAFDVEAQARWPDVRSFRRALWRTRVVRYQVRTALLTAAGLLAGAYIALSATTRKIGAGSGAVPVAVPDFEFSGPPRHRAIADSMVRLVRSELRGHPDFHIAAVARDLPWARAGVIADGSLTITGTEMRVRLVDRRAERTMIDARAPLDRWRALVDSLTYGTLLALWETRSPLAASLPRSALPRTTLGLARFIQAEQLVAAARWEGAYAAYLLAEETDSTCLLCSWRVNDVARWLGRQPDPARTRRYLAHIAAFPADYQSLIRAGQLPLVERLDTLHALTERSGRFLLGWFQLGDELFHRGPLAGRRRGEAIPAFEKAARLRPDFRPAWEHLAWVSIAEGDSIGADRALAALDRRGPVQDAYSQTLRLLMHLGFAWRFVPESRAVAITHEVLQDSAARVSADLGAGPRLLPSFDAPRGAVAFGRLLEEDGSRDLERSGLIAEVLGWVALGDPDRARERARRLVNLSAEPEVALFAAELDASLALLEGATPGPDALRALRTWTTAGAAPEPIRRRAAWMSTLLRRRTAPAPLAGERTGAPPAVGQVGPFAVFLQADSIASAGNPGAAIARMRAVDVDEAALRGDPFYRTVARLALAEWRARLGDVEGARGEMLWHEHTFVGPLPTGLPQAAEIDWAFGTLARWRLARLLDRDNASRLHLDEACRAYGAVARHWGQAGGSYGAWAATARDRLNALRCDDAGL